MEVLELKILGGERIDCKHLNTHMLRFARAFLASPNYPKSVLLLFASEIDGYLPPLAWRETSLSRTPLRLTFIVLARAILSRYPCLVSYRESVSFLIRACKSGCASWPEPRNRSTFLRARSRDSGSIGFRR
jgi:hypothetical protein